MQTTDDIARHGGESAEGHAGAGARPGDGNAGAQECAWGNWAKTIRREDGTVINDDDVVEGIVLLRKGAEADATLEALHQKIAELNGTTHRTACYPPESSLFPISIAAIWFTTRPTPCCAI